jgi:hypothetical protein
MAATLQWVQRWSECSEAVWQHVCQRVPHGATCGYS